MAQNYENASRLCVCCAKLSKLVLYVIYKKNNNTFYMFRGLMNELITMAGVGAITIAKGKMSLQSPFVLVFKLDTYVVRTARIKEFISCVIRAVVSKQRRSRVSHMTNQLTDFL